MMRLDELLSGVCENISGNSRQVSHKITHKPIGAQGQSFPPAPCFTRHIFPGSIRAFLGRADSDALLKKRQPGLSSSLKEQMKPAQPNSTHPFLSAERSKLISNYPTHSPEGSQRQFLRTPNPQKDVPLRGCLGSQELENGVIKTRSAERINKIEGTTLRGLQCVRSQLSNLACFPWGNPKYDLTWAMLLRFLSPFTCHTTPAQYTNHPAVIRNRGDNSE